MATVRAAILAAGRGVRMGGERPKTLLPLGDHPPMLDGILRGLATAGIDDILIVTGFKPEEIQSFVEERFPELSPTWVFNARYASWGNFHSVRVALDQSPSHDLMVVNCDAVVDPGVYRRVADTKGDLVLAVQQRMRLDSEDMRVRLDGRKVIAIGKDLKRSLSHGEYTGVSLLRRKAALAYQEVATRWQWEGNTSGYYEDVYDEMLGGLDARAADVGEGEYAEVDVPEDVPAAIAVLERTGAAAAS